VHFEGTRDRGIDATVLDISNGYATPYRYDLQIRTSANYSRCADGFAVRIDPKHRKLWSNSNVPVFLVCIDTDTGKQSETKAFWRMIVKSDAKGGPIIVTRRNVFGPASRGQVLSELRRSLPPDNRPIRGTILACPQETGPLEEAKTWYHEKVIKRKRKLKVQAPAFGQVDFSWHGWRHITRVRTSRAKIQTSLRLLPCAIPIVRNALLPVGYRPLDPITRGNFRLERTLLFFERKVTFTNRSPALVRVTVKQSDKLPVNWVERPPDARERSRKYTFYSIEERQAKK
jgi:hypothetical protein